MARRLLALIITAGTLSTAGTADAQPLGTFRWQLQPYCNVLSLAVTQNGAVFGLEGTDNQCGGGAGLASVVGTAFQNPDGTIGLGLTIVASPGGAPVHVDAAITIATLSGTWRDSVGNGGAFVRTSGPGTGGSPRPLPLPIVPAAIQLRSDGGLLAGGNTNVGTIPTSGPGVRMMWHPAKGALRAGSVDADQWDDSNVGRGSTAFGEGNVASGTASTALGLRTLASGTFSTSMGLDTTASGQSSTAMGSATIAAGAVSLASGVNTSATGSFSTAMGMNASTFLHTGSFVYGDASTFFSRSVVASDAPNQFMVRADGGYKLFSNAALTAGVQLAHNGNQWTSLSDAGTKSHVRELAGDEVLAQIAAMPVREWSYISEGPSIRHVGPTAQDFHAAFGLGEDPLRIGTLDASGVALAAVHALEARTRELRQENRLLSEALEEVRRELREWRERR